MISKFQNFIEHSFFQIFITSVIIFNAVLMGLQLSYKDFNAPIEILNDVCLVIFVIEILLKLVVYRLSFFKSAWNIFDFAIVAICLSPQSSILSTTRLLRILRVLRLISIFPKIRLISSSLLKSIPSMLGVGLILLIIFYIYTVIVTELYAETFPQWFGTLGESAYSLFQIMTFESWSMGIVRPVMEVHPNAWIVFISFILIGSYVILNLVIAVLIDSVNDIKEDEKSQKDEADKQTVLKQILVLQQQVAEMKGMLEQHNDTKK